jgi:hypothetical protein
MNVVAGMQEAGLEKTRDPVLKREHVPLVMATIFRRIRWGWNGMIVCAQVRHRLNQTGTGLCY